MSDINLCASCGRMLKESGFSNLCERCSPSEPINAIGGVVIVRGRKGKGYITPKDTSNALPQKKHTLKTVHILPDEEQYELDIDTENTSRDELVNYRNRIDAEIGKLREQLTLMTEAERGLPENRMTWARKNKLGRISQRLQQITAKKPKPEGGRRKETFSQIFTNEAKRLLPEELYNEILNSASTIINNKKNEVSL